MKVLLTNKVRVTSKKDGKDYHIFHGISADGQVVDLVIGQDKVERLGIVVGDIKVLPVEHLKEMFEASPLVDVDFDQRGQLVGIENIKAVDGLPVIY